MKKTLLSLATFTLGTIITIGVVKASLEIGDLFHNNKPIVNTAYTQLLNDYDNSWGYNDNISISCDAEGETVTIVTPKVNDYIPDPVPEYRLFLSPYRVSQIKSGDPSVDNEKIIMIHQNIGDSAVLPSFKISSSDVESDQPYYGFIVPTDIYEEVGTPSKEICFQLNKNVCMLDTECDTFDLVINPTRTNITLKPGLNTFSTPAIVKSITFSNGGSNISISRMKNGKWERFAINSETLSEVRPLEGFLIRNDNSEAITMTLLYDTDNSSSLMITKDLDAGWNFLGVTNTTNPFNVIADATASLILDLTNGQSTNLIQLGKTFLNASKYMLGKAYAVFVNKSGGIYGGQNNYGDDNDEQFKSCWTNPDILCNLDDQGNLLTPETCPSYCLREELINNISESVEYTKGESSEREVFNGYFKSKKGTIGIDKINIFCGNEEGFCFSNMIFYLNIGQSNYIINNQGSLTLNNISVEENKSIPISIYAYTNNSNFERVGKYMYYLRLNLSNGDEELIRLVPMYVKNPGGQTYENRLVYSYERAYENGIISESTIDNANLYKALTNSEMRAILRNFAKYLGRNPDSTATFLDGDLFVDEDSYANRGDFGTALSRILWRDQFDGGEPYYARHLRALEEAGIMNDISHPEQKEIKGFVLIMLMDISKSLTDCGVLNNDVTKVVEFPINETSRKTVFYGTYTANKQHYITDFHLSGDYNLPGTNLTFYIYLNGEEIGETNLESSRYNDTIIELNTGETINIMVEAKVESNEFTGKIEDIKLYLGGYDENWIGIQKISSDLAPIRIVESNTCGNGEEDEGEDCDNCPEDLEICD